MFYLANFVTWMANSVLSWDRIIAPSGIYCGDAKDSYISPYRTIERRRSLVKQGVHTVAELSTAAAFH